MNSVRVVRDTARRSFSVYAGDINNSIRHKKKFAASAIASTINSNSRLNPVTVGDVYSNLNVDENRNGRRYTYSL